MGKLCCCIPDTCLPDCIKSCCQENNHSEQELIQKQGNHGPTPVQLVKTISKAIKEAEAVFERNKQKCKITEDVFETFEQTKEAIQTLLEIKTNKDVQEIKSKKEKEEEIKKTFQLLYQNFLKIEKYTNEYLRKKTFDFNYKNDIEYHFLWLLSILSLKEKEIISNEENPKNNSEVKDNNLDITNTDHLNAMS